MNVGVTNGSVNIEKSVESTNGSITVKMDEGDIHVGNDPKAEDTVKAKQNVTLETGKGKITIDGKTSTVDGNIRVYAASDTYDPNGENIVFGNNGKLAAGQDANLITKNGDLVVTDHVTAGRSLNVETQGKGNITMATDVTVKKDMTMKTENGNIDVGHTITATEGSVSLTTGTGNITIGANVTANKDVNIAHP